MGFLPGFGRTDSAGCPLDSCSTPTRDTFLERLGAAYRWLWTNTTGREYSDIMRENPLLLIIPASVIIVVSGWKLPRRYWGRAVMFYITFGIGFLSGHVFW